VCADHRPPWTRVCCIHAARLLRLQAQTYLCADWVSTSTLCPCSDCASRASPASIHHCFKADMYAHCNLKPAKHRPSLVKHFTCGTHRPPLSQTCWPALRRLMLWTSCVAIYPLLSNIGANLITTTFPLSYTDGVQAPIGAPSTATIARSPSGEQLQCSKPYKV
jgi:hypothetical protein